MKTMKKLFSIVLVLALVLSLGISAMAAGEKVSIKVGVQTDENDDNVHEYSIFQIFKGTQAAGDAEEKLASVEWGNAFTGDNLKALKEALAEKWPDYFVSDTLAKLAAEAGIQSPNEATQYAAVISKYFQGDLTKATELAHIIAKYATIAQGKKIKSDATSDEDKTVEVDPGFYLIVDTTIPGADAEGFVYNETILQVTGNITIKDKYDVPSSKKKVLDNNDSEKPVTEVTLNNENGLEWQDSADHDVGDIVWFKLTGTMPEDLYRYDKYAVTFHDKEGEGLIFNSASVKVKVGDTEITDGFTVLTQTTDPKAKDADCTFEVVFDDVKALKGVTVTDGTVITILYSCTLSGDDVKYGKEGNPNEMQMEYTNSSTNEGTGKTPWDKVIVFTYKLNTNKVDGHNEALGGAGFILLKEVAEGTEGYADAVAVEWKDLHTQENNALIKYNDVVYKVVKNYGEVSANTKFGFDGIDDGNYLLVESIVPDGYNKADDMEFVVGATHDDDSEKPELKALTVKDKAGNDLAADEETGAFTVDVNAGTISNDVVNQSGLQLPETGGIGTTILYVVGGVLVAVAVIFLITKKRMGKAQR